jgi:hypothetical protein
MPTGDDRERSAGGASVRMGLGHRLLLALPRMGTRVDKEPLGERLSRAFLKPEPETEQHRPGSAAGSSKVSKGSRPSGDRASLEELQAAVRSADDKERLIGLLAAPLAAIISILVTGALITNDPPALLKNGKVNKLHVSVTVYHDLAAVLLALSVLMLAMAWFRKRLFLGIVMALYGLAVFNLRYWGFGIPYVMCAAWLMIRSYRLQRSLREATGTDSPRSTGAPRRRTAAGSSRPGVSKRYTPPA